MPLTIKPAMRTLSPVLTIMRVEMFTALDTASAIAHDPNNIALATPAERLPGANFMSLNRPM